MQARRVRNSAPNTVTRPPGRNEPSPHLSRCGLRLSEKGGYGDASPRARVLESKTPAGFAVRTEWLALCLAARANATRVSEPHRGGLKGSYGSQVQNPSASGNRLLKGTRPAGPTASEAGRPGRYAPVSMECKKKCARPKGRPIVQGVRNRREESMSAASPGAIAAGPGLRPC
jgi:hypothetical protein